MKGVEEYEEQEQVRSMETERLLHKVYVSSWTKMMIEEKEVYRANKVVKGQSAGDVPMERYGSNNSSNMDKLFFRLTLRREIGMIIPMELKINFLCKSKL